MTKEKTIPLDEACNVEYGTRVVQKRDGGEGYPVYGGGGATFEMDSFNREDRLIIARFGMSEECARFVAGKFFLNDSGLTVSPKDSSMLQRFLDYQMLYRNDDIYALGKGTAQKNLDVPVFRTLPLFIPTNIAEQQRIVALLDEGFDGIATAKANAEKNLQNARALFESLLNAAIQGELIPQDSRDNSAAELIGQIEKARNTAIDQGRAKAEKSEPLERKMDGVIRLPRTWKWTQLESLTVGISDGVHKKPQYVSNGIPFITVKNLTAGPGISFDELNYVTPKDHREFIKRTHPEKGDILITKDGTIGVVRLIDTDIEFSIFVSVALIKPVMHELAPYLVYALRASCVQSQIVPQGAALKHLYLVDLRRLAIPIPPLKEQKRIVTALDSLSEETQHLVTSTTEARRAGGVETVASRSGVYW